MMAEFSSHIPSRSLCYFLNTWVSETFLQEHCQRKRTVMYILHLTIYILGSFCTTLLERLLLLPCVEISVLIISFLLSGKVFIENIFFEMLHVWRCHYSLFVVWGQFGWVQNSGLEGISFQNFECIVSCSFCFHWWYWEIQSHSHFWFLVCDFFFL